MPDVVEWEIRSTETGPILLSGEASVATGTGTRAATASGVIIPSGVADGSGYGVRSRGRDNAQNLEAWKWVALILRGAQMVADLPQALGTLSARPAWTGNFRSMFGAAHDLITQRGSAVWPAPLRTVVFDDLPVYQGTQARPTVGTDFDKRWEGYFGNHVGYAGTAQSGDRLLLTEDATYYSATNNDTPRFTNNIEIYAPGVTILNTHANATTGLMDNHGLRLLGYAQTLPVDANGNPTMTDEQAQAQSTRNIFLHGSRDKPLRVETVGAVGRTGLNQQGNALILIDPFVNGIIVEDVWGLRARAAGFFGYKGRRAWFNRCRSTETQADAFHAANGCQDFIYTDCLSERSGDDGGAPVRYPEEADTSSSKRIAYIRHRVIGTGHGRGLVDIANSDIYYYQCYIEGTASAGLLWDREGTGTKNYLGMSGMLAQALHLKGCNWGSDDHGTIFTRNPDRTADGIGGVVGVLESILIEDAHPGKNVFRGVGGTNTATNSEGILAITTKDIKAIGGPGNNNWFGGNNLSRFSPNPPAPTRAETAGADSTPPTIVFLAPGGRAVVSGTTAGYPKNSSGVAALGNTGDYRNGMLAFYAGHVLGLTADGVEVRIGDTLVGTVAKSALDSSGRGYLEGVDYSRFRNGAAVMSLRAVSSSTKTSTVLYRPITIQNATPGTLAIVPAGYGGQDRVTGIPAQTAWASSGSTPAPAADTTPPSAPGSATGVRTSDTAGEVNWAASSDNVGVTGYRVVRTSRSSGAVVTSDVTSGRALAWSNLSAGSIYDVTVQAYDAAGNLSAATSAVLALFQSTPVSAASPSTTATMLMHIDPSTSAQADGARMTDLTDRVTGKAFTWPTDAERPIVRTLPSGRKVAEFLNGRALLEGSGVAGQAAITVTLVMAQRNLVTALRSGYISAVPAANNDHEKTVGQWAIGGPSATGETAWSSLTVSGAAVAASGTSGSGAYTGFSRALDTYAVVQVALSMDGTPPAIWVDGVALSTTAVNPTTSGLLFLDRILLGARWYDAAPKDGQQDRLAGVLIHQGRISQADRNAIRTWAAQNIGTPGV